MTDMLSLTGAPGEEEENAADFDPRTMKALAPDLRMALENYLHHAPPRSARFSSHVSILGVTYSTSSKHLGNSCVMVRTMAKSIPACISSIINFHPGKQNYFAVRPLKPASVINDPFLQYPILRAEIWDCTFDNLEIVTEKDIECHFARLEIEWEGKAAYAVLSLSRVRTASSVLKYRVLTIVR